jgi:hypothetical protein
VSIGKGLRVTDSQTNFSIASSGALYSPCVPTKPKQDNDAPNIGRSLAKQRNYFLGSSASRVKESSEHDGPLAGSTKKEIPLGKTPVLANQMMKRYNSVREINDSESLQSHAHSTNDQSSINKKSF